MDPRQPPQHPFSRNAASPFGRSPFPPTTTATPSSSTQSPYPPASHASAPTPTYAEAHSQHHQRRPSDNTYYNQQPRPYGQEQGPAQPHSHARHQSASAITSGPPNRGAMPPPSSPPQPGHGANPHQMGTYPLPAPRPPPLSVGPSTAFPGGRELPALGPISRTGSSGSSMSISAMLGGPPPTREPPPQSHYPPASASAGVSGPTFAPSIHASPRTHAATTEYAPYGRPRTPDHQRPYEVRDPRATAAGSPPGLYSTPEVQRYGTPQAYSQRAPPMPAAEQARDQARMSGAAASPPPNSQPKSFSSIPPSRPMDMGRPPPGDIYSRREQLRIPFEYDPDRPPVRVLKFDTPSSTSERERQERDRLERERLERERMEREHLEREHLEREHLERERQERELERRERERRERDILGGDPGRQHAMHPTEYVHHLGQREQPSSYGRPADPREQSLWSRQQSYDAPRGPYDPAHHPRHQEYPVTSAPPYGAQSASSYGQSPGDRYPPSSHPAHSSSLPPSGPSPAQAYEFSDRSRMSVHQEMHQLGRQLLQSQHRPRSLEEVPPPPSVAYNISGNAPPFGSPRSRSMEEIPPPPSHQRTLLGIQEINRKGRISPLPQAVQGAQPQLSGPAGEPGIKSEFGRMFSGIGSGVSGLGVNSPVASGAQLPFSSASLIRREDSATPQEFLDAAGKGGRETSRGKRRKLKDEESKGDDESTGRLTPVGRAKRPKTHPHHHHHQYAISPSHRLYHPQEANLVSHHPHHHHSAPGQTSSPSQAGSTPFKNVKGSTPVPSPTGVTHHHHVAPRSSQSHLNSQFAPSASKPTAPSMVIAKPKQIVSSKAVLDSVADRPRHHLGDVIYEPELTPSRMQDRLTGRTPKFSWKSAPKPLPEILIKGKENCTLIVKISKAHLTPDAREEITSRCALWGTDVYTDDSDVVAACIHAGWIKGEWPEDVDVEMLDLDEGPNGIVGDKGSKRGSSSKNQSSASANPWVLDAPPKTGPMDVPPDRDLHVTLLILPRLEKYSSMTRFGMRSREWGGDAAPVPTQSSKSAPHDGISFMIKAIRWVTNGSQPQSRLRGQARRDRINKALMEIELGPAWAGNGVTTGAHSTLTEKETTRPSAGEVVSAGTGWWKPAAAEKAPSDGDKENRPVGEPEVAVEPVREPEPKPEPEPEPMHEPEPKGDKPEADSDKRGPEGDGRNRDIDVEVGEEETGENMVAEKGEAENEVVEDEVSEKMAVDEKTPGEPGSESVEQKKEGVKKGETESSDAKEDDAMDEAKADEAEQDTPKEDEPNQDEPKQDEEKEEPKKEEPKIDGVAEAAAPKADAALTAAVPDVALAAVAEAAGDSTAAASLTTKAEEE